MRTLITGGVKSGKSSYALAIAESEFMERHFLATAVAFDDEMRDKIRRHREERAGSYVTIEEPIDIDRYLRDDLIVDCIPMWLGNLMHHGRTSEATAIVGRMIDRMPERIVIVTNETGLGNIAFDESARRYNNLLGLVNQRLARAVDRVLLMVSGCPVVVKEPGGRG